MSVSKKKVEDLANDMETKLKDADTIARRLKEDMFKRQESQDKPKSNIYEVEVVKVLLAKACMKAYFEVFMMAMQHVLTFLVRWSCLMWLCLTSIGLCVYPVNLCCLDG
ncbi:uncharacterized protein LOC114183174 [Vigna unguiculata]|uniref:Uncharacterized protein n=1 Tax=Vigna unguiculata TaxID=3917 RepID=A0A4D6N935_VIGUN|nr:uncharacterized protein LOC114183174 [Vigna unguiculata]QCE10350.1 hypothetical protein DEO72_LG10g1580 [Vigna unguiculata]